ncbi:MAG: helix-turn-helix domain-containing protein [Bacteroidales bacterium]|nr:helix-turn-helix domain-containing protein [Bacteroidales bacterium]
MQKANQLLREKDLNISEIADFIGYKNTGSFTNEFRKRFGFAPSQAGKFSVQV